jgi:hypothetical protein
VETGNYTIAKALLERGADPNPDEINLLEIAATDGSLPLIELLLEHHVQVNKQSSLDRTALDSVNELIDQLTPKPGRYVQGMRVGRQGRSLTDFKNVAALLKKHGAVENLPRLHSICVVQPSGLFKTVFLKGTNDFNRYTALEAVAEALQRNQLRFPDWSKISIRYRAGDKAPPSVINFEEVLTNQQCLAGLILNWGDVLSVPESFPFINTEMNLVKRDIFQGLTNCLKREVELRIDQTTNQIILPATGNKATSDADIWRLQPLQPYFRTLLSRAGIPASKVKHAHVIRSLPGDTHPQSIDLDLSNPGSPDQDFWLRDGDIVEVKTEP